MLLKYGMNPNQDFAELTDPKGALKLLNGKPSVINVLDGLNAWQLVKEIREELGVPAAASFKHVTPSGVAMARELTDQEKKAYQVNKPVSPLATAYIGARGADRLASFGDFIALSHEVDVETAGIIKAEVSDGIIAPGYSPEALEILKAKKKGGYVIFQIDPEYTPPELEERQVFGITIKQKRNDLRITDQLLNNIVTKNKDISQRNKEDIKLGMITLKYTQSNSLCVVNDRRVIGIGSGQQSRILCSNLALTKANIWYQKLKLDYGFQEKYQGKKRTEMDQIIEQQRAQVFGDKKLLSELKGSCLISDGFFPQVDNIELAQQYGIQIIASPMGSIRDEDIISTADKYSMCFINTGIRLFHH
ncbi:MAG: phosphoribosylaminoimidazolecarboxamide formyltransferase [Spirochaetaceae bacterium]|jgi:phosphoribosylaminoimidazolecarboxamide formyltransferase/IMP cyclohydrolase|nr:phosphoribosylaminoimidazolecarboxamide formyltransferase [Spirochaetaceae bacterium]